MDFYTRQAAARRGTRWLIVAFAFSIALVVSALTILVMIFLGEGPAQAAGSAGYSGLAAGAALFWLLVIWGASAFRTMQLRDGGGAVATALGGVRVERNTQDPRLKRLHNIVEEMSIASGVTMPEVYVLEDEAAINAFAAGHSPANAAVAVTRGAVQRLNRDELQGVIAHEFSHILNGDMRLNLRLIGWLFGLMFIALMGRLILRHSSRGRSGKGGAYLLLIGAALAIIGWLGGVCGRVIQAAVCRRRERLADASAVQFTRNPEGLKGALLQIAGVGQGSRLQQTQTEEVAHMLFASGLKRVFATHPPLAERISALDPGFDVSFIDEIAARAVRELRLEPDLEELTSRMHESRVAVVPAAVAASVGNASAADMSEAAAVRVELPIELREFAESTGRARSLTLALLLSRATVLRARQRKMIEAVLGAGFGMDSMQEIDAVQPTVDALTADLRLPALLQLFPALRRLPRDERTKLFDLVSNLARSDASVDVFEFCLMKLLADSLRAELEARDMHGGLPLTAALGEIGLLFAVVAGQGAVSAIDTRRAYEAGISKVLPRERPEFRTVADWPVALAAALDRLETLHPFAKRAVLEGLVTTIAHDGVMTQGEVDLLRTLCAVLQLPLPALLGRTSPASNAALVSARGA